MVNLAFWCKDNETFTNILCAQFEARVPARKFRKYACVGRAGRESEKKTEEIVEHAEEVVWADGKVATEAANSVA